MSANLSFDYLSELYKTNPEEFVEIRAQEIEKCIHSASESSQHRLRGIQFQVDSIREIHKSAPMVVCMKTSEMMHKSFDNLRFQLNKYTGIEEYVEYQSDTTEQNLKDKQSSAKVLRLRQ